MIWEASSKHRSIWPARMWKRRSPAGAGPGVVLPVRGGKEVEFSRLGTGVKPVPGLCANAGDDREVALRHVEADGSLEAGQIREQVAYVVVRSPVSWS